MVFIAWNIPKEIQQVCQVLTVKFSSVHLYLCLEESNENVFFFEKPFHTSYEEKKKMLE